MSWRPVACGVAGLALLGAGGDALRANQGGATGIVHTIDKAPVIADGNVRGQPTDYVITLDRSLDPSVAGRSLAAGDTISVIFPPEFDLSDLGGFPLAGVGSMATCVPGNLQCSTAVMLQGWPQRPIPPPLYSLSIAGNRFVYTANVDIIANPPAAPGIKQLHLLLNGVENPHPGNYPVRVEAETGPGGSLEVGTGLLQVLPRARPSVNVTSVFAAPMPPNPNTIYQTTAAGAPAPFVWTFLLWAGDALPLDEITLRQTAADKFLVRSRGRTVGRIDVDAPNGGLDYQILPGPFSGVLPQAPVIGATPGIGPQPVGRLDLQFVAGSAPGLYTMTLHLNNGNSVTMFVTAI